jgi:hypothetical protein
VSSLVVTFPNGLVLDNEQFGEGFSLSNIEQWWESTEPRLDNEARTVGDGDYGQEEVYYEPRFPVITGRATHSSDPDEVFFSQKRVFDLYKIPAPFPVTVQDPRGTFTAYVRIAGRIGWDMRVGPGIAEFEIPLKADDPLKYGAPQAPYTQLPTSGGGITEPLVEPLTDGPEGRLGRLTLTNTGNAPTKVDFTVTNGGLSGGVEIIRIETGQTYRLERRLLSDSVVRFDSSEGQVWLDEQTPVTGDLTKSDWWMLGPGETTRVQFVGLGDVTGDPLLTALYASAER